MKGIFLKTLIIFGLSTSYAAGGSRGGGHADAVTGELWDQQENIGSKKFIPLEVPGVREIHKDIEGRIPLFAQKMKIALKKKWYFESKELNECPGSDGGMTKLNLITVACQNEVDIRISEDWFNGLVTDPKTKKKKQMVAAADLPRRQRNIIIHEILRGIVLVKNEISGAQLRELQRELVSDMPLSTTDLHQAIGENGFGYYQTIDDIKIVERAEVEYNAILASLETKYKRVAELHEQSEKIAEGYSQLFSGLSSLKDQKDLDDYKARANVYNAQILPVRGAIDAELKRISDSIDQDDKPRLRKLANTKSTVGQNYLSFIMTHFYFLEFHDKTSMYRAKSFSEEVVRRKETFKYYADKIRKEVLGLSEE